MATRRQKRVGNLIKEELSRIFIQGVPEVTSGMISITEVEMSNDLRTAYLYLSFFGEEKSDDIIEVIERRKGFLRKSIASKIKLKYNPKLIFSLDMKSEYEERIENLLKAVRKKNE
jgi:ribosome-binding factor A